MTSTATLMSAKPALGDDDQRIVLHGWSWSKWKTLLGLRGDRSCPRMAYLDGAIELMSPGRGHERTKSTIGAMLEAYCLDRDIPFEGVGSWLLKKKRKKAGAEPDESYVFSNEPDLFDRLQLVIEISWSRGGVRKLEIYRRLEIEEFWFWESGEIKVFGLEGTQYMRRSRSKHLPELDLELVGRLSTVKPASAAVQRMRATLGR